MFVPVGSSGGQWRSIGRQYARSVQVLFVDGACEARGVGASSTVFSGVVEIESRCTTEEVS